jgi:hypothetical protein
MNIFNAETSPANLEQLDTIPLWLWFVPVVVVPGVWILTAKLFKKKSKSDD